MQEYRDGTYGKLVPINELLKNLQEKEGELERTKAVHFGTEEELQRQREIKAIVEWYGETLLDVNKKLDKIIKHFKIYDIIN